VVRQLGGPQTERRRVIFAVRHDTIEFVNRNGPAFGSVRQSRLRNTPCRGSCGDLTRHNYWIWEAIKTIRPRAITAEIQVVQDSIRAVREGLDAG